MSSLILGVLERNILTEVPAPAPILAFPHRDQQYFQGDVEINEQSERAASGLAWAGIATFPNLPSTVLPIGATGDLPCGMQVIGPRWSDLDCVAAARAMSRLLKA